MSRGDGDLTKRFNSDNRDELGELATRFNGFIGKIQHIISSIAEDSDTLASSSEELSATTEELRRGADDQVLQIEQSATTMNEMSQTIVDVAKNSSAASDATKEASEIASAGKKVVEESVESILNISKTVEISAKTIYGLGESSQQIEEIIRVIKEIAEQTNLLALNAAIEAARAGEQGRGFAVVADEVRKLAERTSKSTGEISEMIEKIQTDIDISVISIEDGKAQVEEGVKLSEKAKESLEGIVATSDECFSMVQMIATATEEQSSAVEQVSSTMENIAIGSRTSQQTFSQISDATTDLAKLASELHEIVARFKIHSNAEHISEQETFSQVPDNKSNVSG
jgi:methyl-accepting chemotaxis protein